MKVSTKTAMVETGAAMKTKGKHAKESKVKTIASQPQATGGLPTAQQETPTISPESPLTEVRDGEAMQQKAELEMEVLRRAAWAAEVELMRKQDVKRQQLAEAESQRKKEEVALTKALLEASFDGDDAEIDQLLTRASLSFAGKPVVEASDGHGNTLLSEAAAGGSESTVIKIISLDADPNTKGEFGRTPLWRASFLGKAEVILPLLKGGADPRLANDGGELPVHVASSEAIKSVLAGWDTSKTDDLVNQFKDRREKRASKIAAERSEAIQCAESAVNAALKAHGSAQQAFVYARQELEKRITEYDVCVEERASQEILSAALSVIKDAEAMVEAAKKTTIVNLEALDAARLAVREKKLDDASPQDLSGVLIDIKELDSVLLRDIGDRLANDGRWPMIIDTTGRSFDWEHFSALH